MKPRFSVPLFLIVFVLTLLAILFLGVAVLFK
ncbi:MAG: hypothetical protein UX35_C0003G0018 [Microgenomates group bacterium GW2011_GWA1_46_15]|nr:MAG: hypothetical protein UX00_C0008G0045 [Microgenomates group bacterium GW2011_GWB1_45_17]KKU23882.1 MAG: hypothetical protein UX35_C0003G0018 [Microgenomates group bacterium GW2011_GWA1_46_15]KKU24725.1 MAG: hypothetical protein UX36_C0001G0342 [Microgenomates group bacterium GW2011_GWC1_46_15]